MLNLHKYKTLEKEQYRFSLYISAMIFLVNMIFRQTCTFLVSKSGKLAHF